MFLRFFAAAMPIKQLPTKKTPISVARGTYEQKSMLVLQFPHHYREYQRGEVFEFSSELSEGANVSFRDIRQSGNEIEFAISSDLYNAVGYTNVASGFISGQNNLYNHRAYYRNWRKNYAYGHFVIKTGDGTERTYEGYNDPHYQDPQWRLVKETQPNGYLVHYSYCEPLKVSRIQTTNPSGTLVLNSADFHYDSGGYTVRASNGQSVRYNTQTIPIKTPPYFFCGCIGSIVHLQEVVSSDGVPSTHHLSFVKNEGLWLQNHRREWPDGRFLNIIHRTPDGKVSALQAPAGSDSTPINIASFNYGSNQTTVTDALGNNTDYRFSKEKRITAIEKCHHNGAVYSKKKFT